MPSAPTITTGHPIGPLSRAGRGLELVTWIEVRSFPPQRQVERPLRNDRDRRGPGGRGAAGVLAKAGSGWRCRVRLVGGECPFWACIPSKTLLRPGEALAADERLAGWGGGGSIGRRCRLPRLHESGWMIRARPPHWRRRGVEVLRGRGRIRRRSRVSVAGAQPRYPERRRRSGTTPRSLNCRGSSEVEYWTSRETTTCTRCLPRRSCSAAVRWGWSSPRCFTA